ncbi:helix-turn-helix domain-containing protein [Amycolatopsis sp. WGS_07]|uniref:helix-turn-helix domain-containing protein n=1 Tax=Amycolatopsis sp. WGS_07 TaxID=3076764 RepID=UPI003873BA97
MNPPPAKKGQRIVGDERQAMAAWLKHNYEKGASIRSLVDATGRSYGFVHQALTESGVCLRSRGGGHPRPRPDRARADAATAAD